MSSRFCTSLATKMMLNELEKGQNKNIVTSPLSLFLLLGMIATGANGLTEKQLLDALGSKNVIELADAALNMMAMFHQKSEDGPINICIADGVWIDVEYLVNPLFKSLAAYFYNADVQSVDYSRAPYTVDEVNAWAKMSSKGRIKDVLSKKKIPRNSRLILRNGIHFKGALDVAFEKSNQDFHLLNGETIKVSFMASDCENRLFFGSRHYFGSFDGFSLLKLPYRRGYGDKKEFSLYVFLPKGRKGLEKLMQKLDSDPCSLYQHCKTLKKVTLSKMRLPKFKFAYTSEPMDTMKEMGIGLPFEREWNFAGMVDSGENCLLRVSNIIQKSFIEVNEEGSQAAAVTRGIQWNYKSPPSFVADHPFLFMIKEEVSQQVFFNGLVLNPLF